MTESGASALTAAPAEREALFPGHCRKTPELHLTGLDRVRAYPKPTLRREEFRLWSARPGLRSTQAKDLRGSLEGAWAHVLGRQDEAAHSPGKGLWLDVTPQRKEGRQDEGAVWGEMTPRGRGSLGGGRSPPSRQRMDGGLWVTPRPGRLVRGCDANSLLRTHSWTRPGGRGGIHGTGSPADPRVRGPQLLPHQAPGRQGNPRPDPPGPPAFCAWWERAGASRRPRWQRGGLWVPCRRRKPWGSGLLPMLGRKEWVS